jgi:hypothetical protein
MDSHERSLGSRQTPGPRQYSCWPFQCLLKSKHGLAFPEVAWLSVQFFTNRPVTPSCRRDRNSELGSSGKLSKNPCNIFTIFILKRRKFAVNWVFNFNTGAAPVMADFAVKPAHLK